METKTIKVSKNYIIRTILLFGVIMMLLILNGCVQQEQIPEQKTETIGPVVLRLPGGAAMLQSECAEHSFKENTADLIVEGTVTNLEVRNEETRTFTYNDLKIEKYLKGPHVESDMIRIITEGGENMAMAGQVNLHKGEKINIYLKETDGTFSTVCGNLGIISCGWSEGDSGSIRYPPC